MELNATTEVWNSHTIRKSRRNVPSGRPTVMLEVPVLYGTHSYFNNITTQEQNACRDICSFRSVIPCDIEMYSLCVEILRQLRLAYPTTPNDALQVYLTLRQSLRHLLNI